MRPARRERAARADTIHKNDGGDYVDEKGAGKVFRRAVRVGPAARAIAEPRGC
jgi:hypothetical protein